MNQSYKTIKELEVVGAAVADSGRATSNLKQTEYHNPERETQSQDLKQKL